LTGNRYLLFKINLLVKNALIVVILAQFIAYFRGIMHYGRQ